MGLVEGKINGRWANSSFLKLNLVIDFQIKARALKLESVSITMKGQQYYNDGNNSLDCIIND